MSDRVFVLRPWRFIYTVGLSVLAWAWFGWWAVVLMALIQIDITPRSAAGRGPA